MRRLSISQQISTIRADFNAVFLLLQQECALGVISKAEARRMVSKAKQIRDFHINEMRQQLELVKAMRERSYGEFDTAKDFWLDKQQLAQTSN